MTLLFIILMFAVFGKMIGLAFRMTWGFAKILLTLVFLPVILIALVIGGLISLALPLLVIVGIITLAGSLIRK